MSVKFLKLSLLFILVGAALSAAPPTNNRDVFSELRTMCNNHEAELRVLEEKFNNQEQIIESLQKELKNSHKTFQENVKGKAVTVEQRLTALESSLQLLTNDISSLRQHLEKQNSVILSLHDKVSGYETGLAQHGNNITHLQTALQTLAEVVQEPSKQQPVLDGNSYRVQAGDSLGKIAQQFGVTIKALRDENKLTSDRIIAGQILNIPPKNS